MHAHKSDAARKQPPIIVWFRKDLRLRDHAPLRAALDADAPIVPLFVWSPEDEGEWPLGSASRWWLHHSLTTLAADLAQRGAPLIIRTGRAASVIPELAQCIGAKAVHWHTRYEPAAIDVEHELRRRLLKHKIEAHGFEGALLHNPHELRTKQGTPFKVFTPFWRSLCNHAHVEEPLAAPRAIPGWSGPLMSVSVEDLSLLPTIDWAAGLRDAWAPGERGAQQSLKQFIAQALRGYTERRDIPGVTGTARISPHLAFGEVSPRQIWHDIHTLALKDSALRADANKFMSEIGWREFAHHLLVHFPHTATQPLDRKFLKFKWSRNTAHLKAWQRGMTGYPIVDAGMRQLWHTGWMHNRVRMIVASFLTKDLRIHWLDGARWFWDTLVDADLANNTLGWQWTAGCGADAAPYFRIFSPVRQGERFDSDCAYLRRWIPELASIPNRFAHKPWEAEPTKLFNAGLETAQEYPAPMIDHTEARSAALKAYETLQGRAGSR